MKKTITLLMLLMVLSGVSLTACGPAAVDPNVPTDEELIDGGDPFKVDEEENGEKLPTTEKDEEVMEKAEPKVESSEGVQMEEADKAASEPTVTVKYDDGVYSSGGSYQSPAGSESVSVSVTLKGDVVTGLTVVSNAVNETSTKFQGLFIGGINALVVGKKLDEIGGFSNVNGSSLTPKGFASAMNAIKADAAK